MYVSSAYVADALMTFTPVAAAAATGPAQTTSGTASSSGGTGASPTLPPTPAGRI